MSKNITKTNLAKKDDLYNVSLNKKGQPVYLSLFCVKTKRALFVFTKQTARLEKAYALVVAENDICFTVVIKNLSLISLKKYVNRIQNKTVDEALNIYFK